MDDDVHREADARVVSLLTTEHFTLQSARGIATSEALGRATLYLGTISGTLVALSLLATATRLGQPFVIASLVLAPTLIFLGVVTFLRVLESGMEDTLYARGINRLRHAYLEIAPQWRPYFIQSDRDDMQGVMTNMGLTPGRFQMYLTAAGTVAVINSVLIASFTGGLLTLLRFSITLGFVLTVLVFILSVGGHMSYQRRAWMRFGERFPPRFPSP